jgi:hypothetical protein
VEEKGREGKRKEEEEGEEWKEEEVTVVGKGELKELVDEEEEEKEEKMSEARKGESVEQKEQVEEEEEKKQGKAHIPRPKSSVLMQILRGCHCQQERRPALPAKD